MGWNELRTLPNNEKNIEKAEELFQDWGVLYYFGNATQPGAT